jgi:DNA repair protein RadD
MYKLRDYQKDASSAAVNFFRDEKATYNALMVLPTGSGKSLIIADIAARLNEPLLIFQPSKEILEQNFGKIQSYGIWNAGVYSASMKSKDINRITYATIGSAIHHPELFTRFRFIIVDECHLVNSDHGMYHDFIQMLPYKVLGLTATPYRLYSNKFGGSMLRFLTRTRPKIFSRLIYNVQVETLLQRGYLANLDYYRIRLIDQRKLQLNSTGADYTDRSVREMYQKTHFAESLENVIQRLLVAGRKSILVFTRFVEEAQYLSETLGNKAAVVSSKTDKLKRAKILQAFKSRRILVVANVGILTTGFDYPELDTIVIARPTMSLGLYYQMVGRALRPYPGKEGWIVDLCGNYDRFGRVDKLKLEQTRPGLYAIFSGNKQLTNVYFN